MEAYAPTNRKKIMNEKKCVNSSLWMKNTQTNKKINLAQINFEFFLMLSKSYEQARIFFCFICAQKTYLFRKKTKHFVEYGL